MATLQDTLKDIACSLQQQQDFQKMFKEELDRQRLRSEMCFTTCNERITSLEMTRAKLFGYAVGASAGGGLIGGLFSNLFT